MKLLAGFIAMFWLSLIAAVVVWWQRTVPRRPASDGWVATPTDPADQVQFDPYLVGDRIECDSCGRRIPWPSAQDIAAGRMLAFMAGVPWWERVTPEGWTWSNEQLDRLLRDIRRGETSIPES